MKNVLAILTMFLSGTAFSQQPFPDFLTGTWKMEKEEVFEHWDLLNEKTLKGFTYSIKNGQPSVLEYLKISQAGRDIIYSAEVLDQNGGVSIDFKLSKTDSLLTFKNPVHDFPKVITYRMLTDREILVRVSDGKQEGFSYKLIRQPGHRANSDTSISNPDYDLELAERLGADEYGMKGFILVILKTGTSQTTDKDLIDRSFRGHLENMNRLVEEGKLIVAGPLGKNLKNYRGIFILNVNTPDGAEELLQSDPAIRDGLLQAEIYNWYGSAALPLYLDYSDRIWKIKP